MCAVCFNQPNITRLTSFQPNKSKDLVPHYCNNCIRDILPFQIISDIEFEQLMVVSNLIPKLLNSENISISNLLRLNTQTECKYRSIEWYTKQCSTKKSATFNIVHFNVRSLTKNKDKIQELLDRLDYQPDIMAITESKFNDNNIRRADLENHNLINCNSYSNAGGVALYISHSLLYSKIDQFTRATTYSESLFVEIKLKDRDLVIGVMY